MKVLNKTTNAVIFATVLAYASLVAAEEPAGPPKTENDRATVTAFTELLDRSRDQLDGCRGEWKGRETAGTMGQLMCRQFDGPGDFKGVGTTVVLIGERISMVAAQLDTPEADSARERFERLREQVAADGATCELEEESDHEASFQCDGHRISISYSRSAGNWSTSLTVALQ